MWNFETQWIHQQKFVSFCSIKCFSKFYLSDSITFEKYEWLYRKYDLPYPDTNMEWFDLNIETGHCHVIETMKHRKK